LFAANNLVPNLHEMNNEIHNKEFTTCYIIYWL